MRQRELSTVQRKCQNVNSATALRRYGTELEGFLYEELGYVTIAKPNCSEEISLSAGSSPEITLPTFHRKHCAIRSIKLPKNTSCRRVLSRKCELQH